MILEYAKGVELFDFVQQAKTVDAHLVKPIFLQLVRVVQWMHQHNIVHRDLKLESKALVIWKKSQPY
jgi:serine/threonine protein kinase